MLTNLPCNKINLDSGLRDNPERLDRVRIAQKKDGHAYRVTERALKEVGGRLILTIRPYVTSLKLMTYLLEPSFLWRGAPLRPGT